MPRIVKTDRKELRKERYNALRKLGFSTKEARRRRDQSAVHIVEYIDTERERIVTKKSNMRTESEKFTLKAIRQSRRRERKIDEAPRLKPITERASDFSRWTSDGNFPAWAREYIAAQNDNIGVSPINSYGYRRFYWRYVENLSEDEIGSLADRGDSGIEQAS